MEAAHRLGFQKLGPDPDDKEACRNAVETRHAERNAAREKADQELGYHQAWRKMNRSARKSERVGKQILKIKPTTMAGLNSSTV